VSQETLDLRHPAHSKTDEVAITTLDFPSNETSTFWVGTEEGNVYQANRYDRAGAKAGLNQHDIYKGHSAPVTRLSFHPGQGSVDFSDLFLTSSVDWTVKLWRSRAGATGGGAGASQGMEANERAGEGRTNGLGSQGGVGVSGRGGGGPMPAGGPTSIPPIHSFEEATDYVYDVRWHPVNPAVFGTVDGTGKFDLWNLNVDTEVCCDLFDV
jgi:dynein intermediate chain